MLGLPHLPDMWRLLKEADLDRIRREAERAFQILLVAEDVGDAERLARLLSGPGTTRHPWLRPADPTSALEAVGTGTLDLVVVLSPASGPSPALAPAIDALRVARAPIVVVLEGSVDAHAAVPGPGEAGRVVVAALEPDAAPDVARAVLAAAPSELRLALARHLTPLREPLVAELIDETAKANAFYALTAGVAEVVPVLDVPLNVADIVILTKNQLVMSYRIALASGKKGTPREVVGEVLGVIGGGFLFRQGARQLVGLIPVVGLVPKVAVAYAGTLAIGKAVAAWATYGVPLERDAVWTLYRQALARGRAMAQALVARARSRGPRRPWLRPRRG